MHISDSKNGFDKVVTISPITKRLIDTSAMLHEYVDDPNTSFLHAILCQVGLPRARSDKRVFFRQSGSAGCVVTAGSILKDGELFELPLPYGTIPRLIMVHISTEAIKNQSKIINIEATTRQFLEQLGVPTNGGSGGGYTRFRKQMSSLANCHIELSFTKSVDGKEKYTKVKADPVQQFEAWVNDIDKRDLWPHQLELSSHFYETLTEHAVPLRYEALSALKHSSLSLDIYAWLANRLCRVKNNNGSRLSWSNLQEQFGQEYSSTKKFKQNFLSSLRQVKSCYPDARIEQVRGGLKLLPSPPPIPRSQVRVILPGSD